MKLLALIGGLVGMIAAFGGLLVATSGVIPIKASSGHWAITEWFLQFSKTRSVAMHTLGMTLPDLSDPALVMRGAGAYESGCRPCHGSPELHNPRIARAMLPPPPYLPERVPTWEPEELFYIVKHGIKFTGMPAWPAQARDDEVRAVVAFLLKFPSLDKAGYAELVHGEVPQGESNEPLAELGGPNPPPKAARDNCARCHGRDGRGRGGAAFPRIAGQRAEYLVNALRAYASDERYSGIMQPIAAALSDAEMRELAGYYAKLPASSPPATADPVRRARGEKIATEGIPSQQVPSCSDCHGPSSTKKNSAYPTLAGLHPEYLATQLGLLQKKHRGGSSYVHIMHKIAPRLGAEQVKDVASYYGSVSP
jgi:cytochrome c553